jgi:hypothetical protein
MAQIRGLGEKGEVAKKTPVPRLVALAKVSIKTGVLGVRRGPTSAYLIEIEPGQKVRLV